MKTKKNIKIDIVEDNKYYNTLLTKYVNTICSPSFYPGLHFDIHSYNNGQECIEHLDDELAILILDYYLDQNDESENLTGLDVLKEVKLYSPDCKVILVSELQSKPIMLELMSAGVYAYVDKNLNSINRIGSLLQQALNEHRARA